MFFISFPTGKDLFPWSILCFRSHFTYICSIFNNYAVNALPFLLTSTLADEHIATPEMGLPCCNCLIRESSLTSEQTLSLVLECLDPFFLCASCLAPNVPCSVLCRSVGQLKKESHSCMFYGFSRNKSQLGCLCIHKSLFIVVTQETLLASQFPNAKTSYLELFARSLSRLSYAKALNCQKNSDNSHWLFRKDYFKGQVPSLLDSSQIQCIC